MKTSIDRRAFIKGGLAAGLGVALAGCSTQAPVSDSGDSDTASAETGGVRKVSAILISSASQVTAAQGNAIQAYCDEQGAECSVQYYEQDVSAEAAAIENAITSGVDILFIQPQSGSDCVTEIQKAHDAGIVVLIYGMKDASADYYSYYCGEDGHAMGYLLGQDAAAWANENLVAAGQQVVAALGTYSVSPEVAVARYEGFREALEEGVEGVSVIEPPFEAAYKEEGLEAGENILQSHPEVNLVAGCNDQSTIGVYEAFLAGGKEGQTIGMFGIDGTAEAMALIAQDTMFKETIAIDASQVSCDMLEVGFGILDGVEPESKDAYWDGVPVTDANVDDYEDLWADLVG